MCLSLLEMALLLLPPLLLAIALTIHQRLPKDRQTCIGRTRGDEKTLVKSSNDCKLALHIGCAPNTKEYPRCCLPIISFLAHAHACIQSLMRKPHFHTSESHTSVKNVGWLQPRFDSDSLKESSVQTCAIWVEPKFNPGSSCSADMPLVTCR